MHYQSINRPLPVIHENTNIYRFHHQQNDVERSRNKLEEATEAFKICQILVDQTYNKDRNPDAMCKRFFVYYNKDNGTILGDFSAAQFNEALDEYIDLNQKVVNQLEKKRDPKTGGLVYADYSAAHNAYKAKLFRSYWGNDLIGDRKKREALFLVATGTKGVGKTRETMRYIFQDYCNLPLPPVFFQ